MYKNLHDAEVVQNRKERCNEDDNRQHLEGEYRAELIVGSAELIAEHEPAAFDGVAEHVVHPVAQRLEPFRHRRFQDDKGEAELETQPPIDDAGADRAAIGREQERHGDDDDQPEQPGEPLHSNRLYQPTTSRINARSSGMLEEIRKAPSTICAASST